MNIVLFAATEVDRPLAQQDPRARHIQKVLRLGMGDSFDAGLINGPRGKATLAAISEESVELAFTWEPPHSSPPPTALIIGLPRPQTARDILRDATTLGATALHFVTTNRTDPNYAASSLWTSGEWSRHLITGAAQAFATHLPEVTFHQSLAEVLSPNAPHSGITLALDVYEAATHLAHFEAPSTTNPVTLLIGPERGWASTDRSLIAQSNIPLYHLGDRVLRSETAVTAAISLLNAARARV